MPMPPVPQYASPAEELADRLLRAAGSGLRYYTLYSTRSAIIRAAQDGIEKAAAAALADMRHMAELEAAAEAAQANPEA